MARTVGNCLESILMGWICSARRIPGSNLLLKTVVLVKTTLSPGDCCRSLMTDFQGCFLFASYSLQQDTRQRKGISLSLLHLSEGCSKATALLKTRQDASKLGWNRQTHASSCHHLVPLPAWKHAQNPPAWNRVDLGFPSGAAGGWLSLQVWCGGGGRGEGEVEEEEKEEEKQRGRRRRKEGDAGVLVSQPSAKSWLGAAPSQ